MQTFQAECDETLFGGGVLAEEKPITFWCGSGLHSLKLQTAASCPL